MKVFLTNSKMGMVIGDLEKEMEKRVIRRNDGTRFVRIEGLPVKKDMAASSDDLKVFRNKDEQIAVLQEGCYTLAEKDGEIIESSIYTDPQGRFYHYRAVSDSEGKVKSLSESRNPQDGYLYLTESNGIINSQKIPHVEPLKADAAIQAYKG